ncbi:MAG: DUF4129 domain-containing protein [Thermoplasmatota archaeon]
MIRTNKKNLLVLAILLVFIASWSVGNYISTMSRTSLEGDRTSIYEPRDEERTGSRTTIPERIFRLAMYFGVGLVFFIIIGSIIAMFGSSYNDILSQIAAPTAILLIFAGLLYLELGTDFSFTRTIFSGGGRDWAIETGEYLNYNVRTYGNWILLILISLILGVMMINFISNKKENGFEEFDYNVDEEEKEEIISDFFETVDNTIQKLTERGDIKATIIECYREMCIILEKNSRISFKDFMTPREFERKTIEKLGISEIRELTILFQEARYSDHKLSEEKRDEAINVLRTFKTRLTNT